MSQPHIQIHNFNKVNIINTKFHKFIRSANIKFITPSNKIILIKPKINNNMQQQQSFVDNPNETFTQSLDRLTIEANQNHQAQQLTETTVN